MDQYQSVDEDCYRQYKAPPTPAVKRTTEQQKSEFSTAISWPILLAIIPTLGAFVAGSAEVWSDFIMILLILYYVYKWITGKLLKLLKGNYSKFPQQSLGLIMRVQNQDASYTNTKKLHYTKNLYKKNSKDTNL